MESRACLVPWAEEHSEHRENAGRRCPEAVELRDRHKIDGLSAERDQRQSLHIS